MSNVIIPSVFTPYTQQITTEKSQIYNSLPECTDKDAADCLANGHHKSKRVPTAWGQK